MKFLLSVITAINIATNVVPINTSIQKERPKLIDAYILAYETMYTANTEPPKDYIILDMESIHFTDTTYEERESAIQYFNKKFNKQIVNASLFKLQQIGLADKSGALKINAHLLMFTNVESIDKGIVTEGYKWVGPVAAYKYRVSVQYIDDKWQVTGLDSLGVA